MAAGRLGNRIERVRLRDGRWGVLKRGQAGDAAGDVRAEARRLAWLAGRGGAPRLLWAGEIGPDAASLALMLPGRPAHLCTDDPGHAITLAASALRELHAIPIANCPFGEAQGKACVLIHGDFALPNVVIDGQATGVVDWSLATIGHREADIDDAERSIHRNFGPSWLPMFQAAYDTAVG